MPVQDMGPAWNEFEAWKLDGDVEPTDGRYALHAGRLVSRFMIENEIWSTNQWTGYKLPVEWEVDGEVTKVAKSYWEKEELDSEGGVEA